MENTEIKRKGNPNWQKGKSANPKKVFSKDRQPPGKNKSEGKLIKKRGAELAMAVLNLTFKGLAENAKGEKTSELKKMAADYFGIPQNKITVELMLHLRQAEKGIKKSDTIAYTALMNRAFGLPKQDLGFTDTDGNDIFKVGYGKEE